MLKKIVALSLIIVLLGAASGCQTAEPDAPQNQLPAETTIPPTAALPAATAEIAAPPDATATVQATATSEPTALQEVGDQAYTSTPPPTATPTETPIPVNPLNSVTLEPVLQGVFTQPLYLTHAGDERLFVVEQSGVIRVVEQGQLLDTPFLDIRDRTGSSQLEQGLLGLAFHPDYASNGAFFVNYTDKSGNTHISRFMVSQDDANLADPDSETVLLTYQQPYPNHNGGQVAFGPDGYLYIGAGDGGSANDPLHNGQNPTTILGSLLRLDVNQLNETYLIPATNPFVGSDEGLNEIWAWGLRNPWRFSFDRLTGDLYIADVGQNLWEEVNFQSADSQGGENYGWNIMEGTHCFASDPCDSTGLVPPIFEYSHGEGCSITGGYVYRGSEFPELYGNYFVADYCQGTIWRLVATESGEWASALVHDSPYVISSFGEDAAGELYILDHTGGSLYRIVP